MWQKAGRVSMASNAQPPEFDMKGTKIELLPEDIRALLHRLIDSKRYTSQDIADMVNTELANYAGNSDVEQISKNLVWREAKKMEEVANDMRRCQDYATAMADKLDLSSLGEQGMLLQSMLMSAMFKTTAHAMSKATDDAPVDIETLGDLVLSIQRLQRTANSSAVLKKQLKDELLAEQKAKLDTLGGKGGVTAETQAAIREALGIV
jgi:hypothetical protein